MAWSDKPQPTLTTDRLLVRPATLADAPRLQALVSDRAIADTTASIPHPYPEGGAETFIATHGPRWTAGTGIVFCAALRESDDLIGVIGLDLNPANDSAELGYWIGLPYWGKGYTTESAAAVVDFAFGVVGLNRIYALHMTRNPASGRVMEKLGLQPEGLLRQAIRKWGRYEDLAVRSMLRSEWEGRRG